MSVTVQGGLTEDDRLAWRSAIKWLAARQVPKGR